MLIYFAVRVDHALKTAIDWLMGVRWLLGRPALPAERPSQKCDADEGNLNACVARLEAVGAPVEGHKLGAKEAAPQIAANILQNYRRGLHFCFLDPFNLGSLDFSIIEAFNQIYRIDLLMHVSAMDLFDTFAPGWREKVDTRGAPLIVRQRVVEFWREKVEALSVYPSPEHKLISGDKNQPLYWLILAASHELAHQFWGTASNPEGQGSLDL